MVIALIEADSALFELPPPPSRLHVRFLEGVDDWTIVAWTRSGGADLIRAWGKKAGFTLSSGPGQGQVAMFSCERLPGICSRLVEMPDFATLICESDQVEIPLNTDRKNVQQMVSLLEELGAEPVLRHIGSSSTSDPGDPLTERQREALQQAFQMGYYSVPRESTLEDVAGSLDMSAGGLSELLRRAEAQLVASYLGGMGSEMETQALPDKRPVTE